MSRLIHTGLGSSSLIAHVLHSPPPPHTNIFVIGPAVIKHTHGINNLKSSSSSDPLSAFWVRFPNERNQRKQAHPVSKYQVPHGSQPRHGWAPDPPMVGIRSPIGLVVGSCTSHPGVLGSIPKREEPEPGKTGAPCVKVPGSSRVPGVFSPRLFLPLWPGVGGGGLMAGKRRRPAAEDGVPPSLQIPPLTHILLARSPAPY
jgi:hypothetical protein